VSVAPDSAHKTPAVHGTGWLIHVIATWWVIPTMVTLFSVLCAGRTFSILVKKVCCTWGLWASRQRGSNAGLSVSLAMLVIVPGTPFFRRPVAEIN
jgi:hypothetical protein